ncbi:EamA family transporter [Oceanibaculum pacificum]|uniref:Uncharacterized protein n=1 Tax=Oceanibaculum pacificum TaxID=580166 RepID=A0A154W1Q1_9PROT|nr:EamA family transporter [Oceanibaculum pacificum]KZD07387.1 hypothetical protein AUP43_02375 [Oceanibaculum pacificum]
MASVAKSKAVDIWQFNDSRILAMHMTLQDWALLLLLSVLWGGSFFFVAVAVEELPPLTVVALRTGIAALTLLVIVRLRGERWPFAKGAIGEKFEIANKEIKKLERELENRRMAIITRHIKLVFLAVSPILMGLAATLYSASAAWEFTQAVWQKAGS